MMADCSSEHSEFDVLEIVVARASDTTNGRDKSIKQQIKDDKNPRDTTSGKDNSIKHQIKDDKNPRDISKGKIEIFQHRPAIEEKKLAKNETQLTPTGGSKRTKERSEDCPLTNSTSSTDAFKYALNEEQDKREKKSNKNVVRVQKGHPSNPPMTGSSSPSPPQTLLNRDGVRRPSRMTSVGAHHSGEFSSPSQDFGSLEFSMGESFTSDQPAATASGHFQVQGSSLSGLTVAMPILEEDPLVLPQATPEQENAHRIKKDRQQSTDQCGCPKKRRCVGISVLFMVVALVVAVVSVVTIVFRSQRHNNTDKEQTQLAPTNLPTQAPTALLSKEEWILSQLSPETRRIINNYPESPQAMAFDWILEEVNDTATYPQHPHPTQRYSLAVLYYALNGDEWLANEYWLDHNVSECEWYGKHNFGMKEELGGQLPYFLDDFKQPPPSERCNEDGLYSHLWLDANGLVGSIPEELYHHLDSLKTISMGFNQIEGSISTSIGKLTDLIGIFVPFAALTGTLPSEFGLLSSLEVVNFFVNGLSGEVPDTLWNYPNMTCWAFTSSNPQIQAYTLPTSIGLMTRMRWFAPERSNAMGSLPTQIGLLTDTVGFWFSGVEGSETVFTGTLPTELGLMTYVLTMEMNSNALTGTVPTEFGQLEKVNYLDLHNNRLTGNVPMELGYLSDLENLLIQGNGFSGVVPEVLCNISGSCYAYPSHCASLDQPLLFDCGIELCGCDCSCNNTEI